MVLAKVIDGGRKPKGRLRVSPADLFAARPRAPTVLAPVHSDLEGQALKLKLCKLVHSNSSFFYDSFDNVLTIFVDPQASGLGAGSASWNKNHRQLCPISDIPAAPTSYSRSSPQMYPLSVFPSQRTALLCGVGTIYQRITSFPS